MVFVVPSLSSGQSTSGSIGYNAVHPGSETVNSTVGFNPVGSNSDPNNSNNATSVTEAVTGLSAGGIDFGVHILTLVE